MRLEEASLERKPSVSVPKVTSCEQVQVIGGGDAV